MADHNGQTEHPFIQHQGIGDAFSGVYFVEQLFVKLTVKQSEYTDMTLRDKSGSRNVKHWARLDGIEKGDWVFISALVGDYQGAPSIVAKNVEKETSPPDLENYVPVYPDAEALTSKFDALKEEMVRLAGEVKDETCVALVEQVYGNSRFFSNFLECPGSDRPHYGCVGGLLANTVRVTDAAFQMSEQYGLTDEENVILLAAGLIHRVGVTDAYEFEDCMPRRTKAGKLLGVNNLTLTRVSEALKRVVTASQKENGPTINQEMFMRVLHAMASYDEVAVKSMTKEAMVLSTAHRGDGVMVDAMDFIDTDLNNGDEFTAFDPLSGRNYYTGISA